MNCSEMQTIWDACRDQPGSLPQRERAAFAEHLRRCPACAALWADESGWLVDLAAEAAQAPASPGGLGKFRGQTLARWDEERGRTRNPILARLRFLAWPTLAAAAAVVLAVFLAPQAPLPTPVRRPIHVGTLVQALEHSYIFRPGQLLGTAKKHASELAANVSDNFSISTSDIPDPADFFAPAPEAPTPRG